MIETISSFPDRLMAAVDRCQTPLIAGIDPRLEQMPGELTRESIAGNWLSIARSYLEFSKHIIDVVARLVPAVKIQAAFFEALGPAGMQSLGEVIDHASSSGLIVILDGKRNDIGTTAEAYASAWLGRRPHSPWNCDALTVNPYMGYDSLTPFRDRATRTGSGIFVLVKTSNPGSDDFQELDCGERKLYHAVGRHVEEMARATKGECGYGAVGAVVGATHPAHLTQLRELMPHTLFLVPGFGAQGATAGDLRGAFDAHGRGAVVNSSRGIIFAWRDKRFSHAATWQRSVELATIDSIEKIREIL
jgi:orotidine-5'-phosphate decarboxylase